MGTYGDQPLPSFHQTGRMFTSNFSVALWTIHLEKKTREMVTLSGTMWIPYLQDSPGEPRQNQPSQGGMENISVA